MKRIAFHDIADANACAAAVRAHLDNGGIIAYPTETVYGLGCALQRDALENLAKLKGRDAAKSFLLLAADPFELEGLTWNDAARALANIFWPGPLTIAVNADPSLFSAPVLSPNNTVAVRQTSFAPLRALLENIEIPITSTSANTAGLPPARSPDEVAAAFGEAWSDARGERDSVADIMLLDGGPTAAGTPSTLVDCARSVPRLLREGAITAAMLRAALTAEGFTIDV